MSLTRKLTSYLWPMPPASISDESKAAFAADMKATGNFGGLDVENRMRVDVWIRHRDNLARTVNREYLRTRAKQFAARWACPGIGAWFFAKLAEGCLWIEAPMTFIGTTAAFLAMAFWYAHRSLNQSKT